MTDKEYQEFKERMKENFRNMLGDLMQDINDVAFEALESRNMVVADSDDDYEKADQWCGFLIREIVNEWGDSDIDPFA